MLQVDCITYVFNCVLCRKILPLPEAVVQSREFQAHVLPKPNIKRLVKFGIALPSLKVFVSFKNLVFPVLNSWSWTSLLAIPVMVLLVMLNHYDLLGHLLFHHIAYFKFVFNGKNFAFLSGWLLRRHCGKKPCLSDPFSFTET